MPTTDAPPARPLPTGVLFAGFVGMAALGGVQALYGPAIPGIQRAFGASVAAAGMGLPVHATASFVGVSLWGILERRSPAGPLLTVAGAAFALGALGVAAAPTLGLALASVAVLGTGFGAILAGVNTLLARDPRPSAPGLINVLHALFGLGAVVLPVVLSVGGFRTSFVVIAVAAAVAVAPFWPARDPGPPVPAGRGVHAVELPAVPPRRGIVVWFAAMYVGYLGIEAGVANWMATYLTDLRWSEASAARWTAAFWLAFTVGRFAIAPFAGRLPPQRIVRTALALASLCVAAAHIGAIAPWAFVLTGLMLAPVFPTGLVWLARAAPDVRGGTTYMMLSASVGAAVLPAAVGIAAGAVGVRLVPTLLLLSGGAAWSVATAIAVRTRTDRGGASPGRA